MESSASESWQDIAGDWYPADRCVQDRMQRLITMPGDPAVRKTWQAFFGSIAGKNTVIRTFNDRQHPVAYLQGRGNGDETPTLVRTVVDPARESASNEIGTARATFMCRMHDLAMSPLSQKNQSALVEHLGDLLMPDASYVRAFAPRWTYPDGYADPDSHIVFCNENGPAAVSILQYEMKEEPTCILEALQGVTGQPENMIPVAERIIRSWSALHREGWRLALCHQPRASKIYRQVQERFFSSKPVPDAVQNPAVSYFLLDDSKPRTRKLLGLDERKERDRHKEYMLA